MNFTELRLKYKKIPLHSKIITGLILGALSGGISYAWLGDADPSLAFFIRHVTEPAGQVFLRLLLMLVIPLVFSSLIVGVAGIGDLREIGRVGIKSFAYTVVISGISVLIGLGVANLMKPGKRVDPSIKAKMEEMYKSDAKAVASGVEERAREKKDAPLMRAVKTVIPQNIFSSIAKDPPDMLGLMFFALFLGIAFALIGEQGKVAVAALEGLFAATSKCIEIVMMFAPVAVFCLVFTMMARFGFGLLWGLGWYVAAVLIGLSIHLFGVYSIAVALMARINPLTFFRRIRTVMITAFSTASSNATLPTALKISEECLGVPREINSFVLTVGATANQNGTALYEGVTVLFLAQLAGADLTITQQLMVLYLAIIGGIGTAGVPSGSIPFVMVVLATVGVDPALIAVILGIDRLLDMCRTVLNVTGDITIAAYVARSEGATLLGPETRSDL